MADKLNDYGLTALLLRRGGECVQIVMSCRIFGLHVEHVLLHRFLESAAEHDRRYIELYADREEWAERYVSIFAWLDTSGSGASQEDDGRYEIDEAFEIRAELLRPVTVIA